MSIGTALLGKLATDSFSRLGTEISDLQSRISSGKNDPRSSADPLRAARLSAVTEQKSLVDGYTANAASAGARLALTDNAMTDLANLTQQLQEIALKAANATTTPEGFAGLKAEALSIRDAILGTANTKDAQGRPLFSGYSAEQPFVQGDKGVTFQGDAGRPDTQVSESLRLRTGLNGGDVLMAVPTDKGPTSLFDMVDNLINNLSQPMQSAVSEASSKGQARLELNTTHEPTPMAFDLKGPAGSARISFSALRGASGPVVDAINGATSSTGVTASLADDGQGIVLTAANGGTVTVSGLSTDDEKRMPPAKLLPLDASGAVSGATQNLRADRLAPTKLVGMFGDAVSHLAAQHAEAGSLAAQVDRQTQSLTQRKLTIDESIAGLSDLDVAAAVTKLQSLLLTQQAAQQSFVRISGKTLFDYLG